MKWVILVTLALLLSLTSTPVEAKSILLPRQFWNNSPYDVVETVPLKALAEDPEYLDNIFPNLLSKRARIGGTIVMGR